MDKYRLSLIVIGVLAVGILLGGWFVGVQPQLDRISRADTQRASVAEVNAGHEAKNAQLAKDHEQLEAYRAELDQDRAKIPSARSQQPLIDQLNAAAASAGVTVTALTFDGPAAHVAPNGVPLSAPANGTLVAVPVTLAVTGDRPALEQFAANVQRSARILTVTGSQYSGPEEPVLTLTGTTWVLAPNQ